MKLVRLQEMRASFTALAAIALGLGLAGACASGNSGGSDLLSALEARVAALEARLARGAATKPDSTPLGTAVVTAPDASLRWDPDDASVEPEDPMTACWREIERACREQAAAAEFAHPRSSRDGGFDWRRDPAVQSADASVEGRACLKRLGPECARRAKQSQRNDRLRAWLDAQVTPGRVDAAFSERVKKRLEHNNDMGLYVGTATVDCVPEFCRIRITTDAGSDFALGAVLDTEVDGGYGKRSAGMISLGDATYVTRPGYYFPE